jgi:formamidopyrimidine-DNA glycosylase
LFPDLILFGATIMPELPDVELERRYFERTALSEPIAKTKLVEPALLYHTAAQSLYQNLTHHHFTGGRRHGKYLFARLDNDRWLVLHFGMTGSLACFECAGCQPDYTALLLEFDNDKCLAYLSQRKLGKIGIVTSPETLIEERDLGPDALAISSDAFKTRITQGAGGIKSWLMNQSHLAGIGNIYGDEILFQAKLHPRCAVKQLSEADIARLDDKRRHVLELAIDRTADPQQLPRTWLLPHREQKHIDCPRCGGAIRKTKINGRTTLYCPACQHEQA